MNLITLYIKNNLEEKIYSNSKNVFNKIIFHFPKENIEINFLFPENEIINDCFYQEEILFLIKNQSIIIYLKKKILKKNYHNL